ncbi:YcnI family protein [Herbiconiux sp. 11R-BC]|uniref:YcnI family copper-binding membrane protein n=1 Tax=Herbiconiux sp. 11R-BC TaxID=3111637 RepID=UPI003BFF5639
MNTRSSAPTRTPSRRAAIGSAAAVLTAVAVLAAAPLAASAHVHVEPGQAAAGSYSTLTFKVPNESATAVTTSVTIDLPADTPFTSVSYQPVPGWSAKVVTGALPAPVVSGDVTLTKAPLSVVWTADAGGGIADGQFQEFPISAGAVPDVGSLLLPVHQGYSDGSVVDWTEPTPASGAEPEHPAPVLYVNDTPPADDESASTPVVTAAADAGAGAAADGGSSGSSASTSAALGFGIGGFALGAIALVVAVIGLLRRPAAAGASTASRTDLS